MVSVFMEECVFKESRTGRVATVAELKNLAREGLVFVLADLLKKEQNPLMRKKIDLMLVKGIRAAGRSKKIDDVAMLLRDYKLGDDATLAAIKICEKHKRTYDILCLFNRDDLSNAVMREVIRFCKNDGRVKYLADLLEKLASKGASTNRVESALILAIKVCERRNLIFEVEDLLGRRELPERVKKAASEAIERNPALKMKDLLLGDTVKPPANNRAKALLQDRRAKAVL